jgi:hypothetical protein
MAKNQSAQKVQQYAVRLKVSAKLRGLICASYSISSSLLNIS